MDQEEYTCLQGRYTNGQKAQKVLNTGQYSQKGYQNSKKYPFRFTKMIIK